MSQLAAQAECSPRISQIALLGSEFIHHLQTFPSGSSFCTSTLASCGLSALCVPVWTIRPLPSSQHPDHRLFCLLALPPSRFQATQSDPASLCHYYFTVYFHLGLAFSPDTIPALLFVCYWRQRLIEHRLAGAR